VAGRATQAKGLLSVRHHGTRGSCICRSCSGGHQALSRAMPPPALPPPQAGTPCPLLCSSELLFLCPAAPCPRLLRGAAFDLLIRPVESPRQLPAHTCDDGGGDSFCGLPGSLTGCAYGRPRAPLPMSALRPALALRDCKSLHTCSRVPAVRTRTQRTQISPLHHDPVAASQSAVLVA